MKHYDQDELEAFRNGGMGVLRNLQCSYHLKNCPECRARLKSLEEDDRLLAELRDSLHLYRKLNDWHAPAKSAEAL